MINNVIIIIIIIVKLLFLLFIMPFVPSKRTKEPIRKKNRIQFNNTIRS